MTIRNRLLLLLLAIALTPLLVTSMLQQISIRVAKNRLAIRTREALDENARLALLEQLHSHVEILQRERQLADALLARQAREVELRLAALVPPEEPQINDRPNEVGMTGARSLMTRGRIGGAAPDFRSQPQPGRRNGGCRTNTGHRR